MKLNAKEIELHGSWIKIGSEIKEDYIALRINWLISEYLVKIAVDSNGWNTLYIDNNDGRYWELVYNNSELFGGGAPSLICIAKIDAENKYIMKL